MKRTVGIMKAKGTRRLVLLPLLIIPVLIMSAGRNSDKDVKLVRVDSGNRVDVIIGGDLFTSFRYPGNIEKPFLFPVIAPDGSVITRGFPVEPRKGERVDHPHHIGIWFNHGNINGLDFWNNSSAIPAEKKNEYGNIVVRKINKTESGKKGILGVSSDWNDNSGHTILKEEASYIFSAEDDLRIIDHISTLTATGGTVTFNDSKEGMFAIRVDRAFEMPSKEPLIFTDEKGNPTTVGVVDNNGVSGMYLSSTGLMGDAVWGTRNSWVLLSGKKEGVNITMGIFDHPDNYGYPACAHARGYGLFALNNIGQNSYDQKKEKVKLVLEKGQSVRFVHRFIVQSGKEVTPDSAEKMFREFSREY